MVTYILRRLLWLAVTLYAIVTISFFLVRFAPGSPFGDERDVPEAVRRAMEAKYGYDRPVLVQYALYMGGVLTGDLGLSTKYPSRTVAEILSKSFPVSATLGAFALAFALVVGLAAGTAAASRHGTWLDAATMSLAVVGICVPSFVLGLLLLVLFCFKLPLFPAAGWGSLSQVVLPSLTLGAPFAAYIARLMRASMIEVLRQDYIRTARAKGLGEARILLGHAMKNAILPVVSYLGPAAASILTGSVVVEKIFAIPGMGVHFVNGALNRDLPVVLGTVIVYSALLIVFNLIVDVAYSFLDPRIRL